MYIIVNIDCRSLNRRITGLQPLLFPKKPIRYRYILFWYF